MKQQKKKRKKEQPVPQRPEAAAPTNEEMLKRYKKSIMAASGQVLMGVFSIALGIGISIYAKDFVWPPIFAGLALAAVATILVVREVKAKKRIKEKMEKEEIRKKLYKMRT